VANEQDICAYAGAQRQAAEDAGGVAIRTFTFGTLRYLLVYHYYYYYHYYCNLY
jgi:hypothetical protein